MGLGTEATARRGPKVEGERILVEGQDAARPVRRKRSDEYGTQARASDTTKNAVAIPGLKAAVFDLDGVVLATERIHAKAWTETFNSALETLEREWKRGNIEVAEGFDPSTAFREFTHQEYLDYVDGKDRYVGTDSFLRSRGIELPWGESKGASADLWTEGSNRALTVSGISNTKNVLVNRMIDDPKSDDEKLVIFQSTIDRIKELKAAGVKIAAASSSQNAPKVLEMAGVIDLFDTIVCGLDITDSKAQSKPSPYLFLEAAKRLGVKPDESIVFEDAQSGVKAGHDGGFRVVIGLARKPENVEKLAEFAHVVVRDVEELSLDRIRDLVAEHGPEGKSAVQVLKEQKQAAGAKKAEKKPVVHVEVRPWNLSFSAFDEKAENVGEVLTALGNGYLGMRSSLASLGLGPIGTEASYVAGVFNKIPGETDDLVNLPAWSSMKIHDGKEWIDLTKGKVLAYSRDLDMQTGVLEISVDWQGAKGRKTRIEIEQLVSHDDQHAGGARFSITPLNYSGTVKARSTFDKTVTNSGKQHLDVTGSGNEGAVSHLEVKTNQSEITVRQAVRLDAEGVVRRTNIDRRDAVGQELTVAVEKGKAATIDKIASVSTSRVGDRLENDAARVRELPSFDSLVSANNAVWKQHWDRSDVKIDGDVQDQQAIRFMIYHLLTLGHQNDGRTSLAAKGLSNTPGSGYRGHVFWDTEIFMLPFFSYSSPEIARKLLEYRYHTIDGARAKAKEHGYQGALYAWESTLDGMEETPKWGGPIRIWCGEKEQHISSDVAYAVDQYARVTGDQEFMKQYGAEIMLETARFWSSRPELNQASGKYEIHTVIGPDEFHEGPGRAEGGVDNSVYTNMMARWNIRRAIEVVDALPARDRKQLLDKLKIPGGYEAWKKQALHVADNLKINYDEQTKLFEQFDGYFKLEDPLNSKHTPEWMPNGPWGKYTVHAMDSYLREKMGTHGASWTQINKQADIVMMMYLLDGLFDPEVAKTNFEHYAPRTSHGSSLSNAMHAIVANRMGREDLATKYFHDAMITDLGDEKGNSSGGIHAASLGGAWQAVVNGYGGVQAEADRLRLDPKLREAWDALSFGITYQGVPLQVAIRRTAAGYASSSDKAKARGVPEANFEPEAAGAAA